MPLPLIVVLGVVAGVLTPVAWPTASALAVACASIALVCPPAARRVALAAALLLAAAVIGARARDAALDSTLVAALDPLLDNRFAPPVWLEGRLHDDAAVEADAVLVTVDVERVKIDKEWRTVAGRATISVGGQSAAALASSWTRGRVLRAPALVRRPQIWRNFGGPSERWQRLRRSSDIGGTVKSAALVEIEPGSRLAEWGAAIRREVRRDLMRRMSSISPAAAKSAATVIAILIGDRTSLDDATVRQLQRAGTYHVIAISGGNIAILVVACLVAMRVVIRSRRWVAGITILIVVAYGAVVGDQASVERAVAAAAVVLTMQAAGWSAPAWRVFILAAMAVAVIDPMTAIDAGAWLSFGATLGILLLAHPIAMRLPRWGGRVGEAVTALFAATLAAELALMPVGAAVFSQVSVAGLILNFIAIPAMAVVQLAGIAVVAFSRVLPAASTAAGYLAHWGVVAIIRSANLLEFAPWLAWQTPPVSAWWTSAYYAAGALAFVFARPRLRAAAAMVAATSLAVILLSPVLPAGGTARPGWLRVVFLDVGQGDAIAVQFPTGQSLLVDAGGSASGFDIGTRVVRPALWGLGIARLDWLAVTHGDIDHAGGALGVLERLHPREVWEGVPVPRNGTMQRLRNTAQSQSAAWIRLAAGQKLEVGSAAVDVLNPPVPDWERRDTRNDDSLVLRVSFGDVSVLLTGDISAAVEPSLPLSTGPRLRLLKAPHHGSRTSSSAALVGGWLPQAAFVSVGRGNTFGHPSPEVLARYAGSGVDLFRTDRDGAIAFETDGRQVWVRTATGRAWRLSWVGT